MFNVKLFLILGMSATLLSACAMEDDSDSVDSIAPTDASEDFVAPFLISFNGFDSPGSGNGFIQSQEDTISVYPNDVSFNNAIKNCLINSHSQSYRIVNSLFNSKRSTWMDFFTPYFGTYTSQDDSRIKQWQVNAAQEYDGVNYDYALRIVDMPEGNGVDAKKSNAVEFFYNKDFTDGVLIYSPVNFDKVYYPESIFGHDILCKLSFTNSSSRITNELAITNLADNKSSVFYIHNVYMYQVMDKKSQLVRFAALIDMPNLWFDNKLNAGFVVAVCGSIDKSNSATVLFSGLVKNTDKSRDADYLINENASGIVLQKYYQSWLELFSDGSDSGLQNPSITAPSDGDDEVTIENSGNNVPENSEPESPENLEPLSEKAMFENPAFFLYGNYNGSGTVNNKETYLRAINQALTMMDEDFAFSPYKFSIYHIEW